MKKPVYSDDDDFEPPSKHVCHGSQAILDEITEIKENMATFLKLSKKMKSKIPPGLLKHLTESFKCHICNNTPMRAPIIFARWCKRMLGCQTCDKWYRQTGEDAATCSCPLCCTERVYAETSIVKGLDDFLLCITPLLADDDDTPDLFSSNELFPEVNL